MKVTLVNPPTKGWSVSKAKTVPLGLAYIASYLEKAGCKVRIIDLNISGNKKLEENSDIVGITATTPVIYEALEVAKQAKGRGAITVLGGPHPTSLPDESLNSPFVDYVVRGEGESAMKELCDAIAIGRDIKDVKGISYKKNGHIIHNPLRPYIHDLDELPFPAYHLFPPLNKYTNPSPLLGTESPSASMVTSRGCPYNCIFCYKGTYGRKWRARSPKNVLAEWEYLVKELGVKEICIEDDAFNINIQRSIEICQLIIDKNLIIPWSTPSGIRANLVNKNLLTKMKESGCYRVAFGVEVGTQEMLKRIDKGLTLEQIRNAFRLCAEVGLETVAFFMMGNPGDTEESMEATIKFAKELNPDYAQFNSTTPYPGTRLFDLIKKDGKLLVTDWSSYSVHTKTGFFEYGKINQELIQKMVKRAYRSFYLRPQYVARMIGKKKTWENLPNIATAGLHFLWKGK
jgi:anaerobic magnesium-protoporphyrin IX monomethyl ester cyclase